MNFLTPQEALDKSNQGAALVDVRTPGEYKARHASGARLLPLDTIKPDVAKAEAEQHNGNPLLLLCKSGKRAQQAAEALEAAGASHVYVVTGGTDAWAAAGLPVEEGKGVISLERQVRIAAGSIVLLGVVLGFTVTPGFFWLSGFVGAGLVFAGITDTCGMGMLLARMPWNR